MGTSRKVGLALGSGSARGWAHIGVLQTLLEADIRPDVVAGTSIGALVGAAYAADKLDELEEWVLQLEWTDVVGFMDLSFRGGGLIEGARLFDFFRDALDDARIEDLSITFGAVATDLEQGQEIWLQRGALIDAVRASIAVPGLFTPVRQGDTWLVDGGMVNPVPVSLCRELGADVVIAVDLNADQLSRRPLVPQSERIEAEPTENGWSMTLWRTAQSMRERLLGHGNGTPSLFDVVLRSLHVMQYRITRSYMADDPPEQVIAPELAKIPLLDFHRGREAIDEGRRVTEAALPRIKASLGA